MAVAFVQGAQSAGASNNSTVTISAATAGHGIVSFFTQSNGNTPTAKVGTTALTVSATSATYNSGETEWVAYGNAAGGETAVTWTPGTSATGHGVTAMELSGVGNPVVLDFATPVHTDNQSSATTATPTVTTGTAGSVVCIGLGASASSGTISAWSGTNVAVNIGTVAARVFGGYFITTTTIATAFTANWTNSHVNSILAIAVKPTGGTTNNQAMTATTVAVTGSMVRQVGVVRSATAVAVTGSMVRQTGKAMTATAVAATASMARQVGKKLTATTVAVTASMVRSVGKKLTATTVAVTGSMTAIKSSGSAAVELLLALMGVGS